MLSLLIAIILAVSTAHAPLTPQVSASNCSGVGTCAAPTFSPVAGSYSGTQTVTITSPVGTAGLCYTTDGSTPAATTAGTCSTGTSLASGGTISVAATETVQAIATKVGFTNSSVASAAYTITGGGPVITLVQSNSNVCANGSAPSTCTCALASSVANGDLLIVSTMYGSNSSSTDGAGTLAITDNGGGTTNTYSAFTGSPVSDGLATTNELWANYAKNQRTSGALTFTATISSGGAHTVRISCFEYNSTTGWQATPADVFNTSASTGTSTASAANANLTPAAANELLWAGVQISGGSGGAITAASFTAAGCTRVDTDSNTAGTGWGGVTRAESGHVLGATSSAQACNLAWAGTPTWVYSSIQGFFKPN